MVSSLALVPFDVEPALNFFTSSSSDSSESEPELESDPEDDTEDFGAGGLILDLALAFGPAGLELS